MKNYNNLTEEDGVMLVKIARNAVTKYLKTNLKLNLEKQFKEDFSFNSGVFVTLNNPQKTIHHPCRLINQK